MKGKKTKERTISGTVVPEDWDDSDNVTRVAIKTPDYQEYMVEHNEVGRQLLSLLDSKLRVKGTVRERLDGDMIISVKSFERIEEEEEGQYVPEGHVY